jgi:hypothetical protein
MIDDVLSRGRGEMNRLSQYTLLQEVQRGEGHVL